MRTELLALLAALSLSACATSSIDGDLAAVRERTRAPVMANDLAADDVPVDARRDLVERLSRPIDADEAVRIALLNNRALRAELRELGIARGRLMQAGFLPNPRVEAELFPERDTEVELRVEFDLTQALLAPMRARAARADLDAAREGAASRVLELGLRTRAAFYALQASTERLALAQRSLDAFAAGRDAARALVEAGNIRELDAAQQVAAFERARVSVARMELEVADRREAMNRLMGAYASATEWTIRGELSPTPEQPTIPEHAETRALTASVSLRQMRMRLEATARRTGLSRSRGWIPDVAVDFHALYGNPDVNRDGSWRFGAGVSTTLPIFDQRRGDTRSLEAEFDGMMERYVGAAIDLRSEVRAAVNRARSAHGRARQYERVIVPAQREVLRQTMLQYNAMQIGVFQLLQARREELDAMLSAVDARREYWTAVAALEALMRGAPPLDAMPSLSNESAMPGADATSGGH